MPGTTPVYGFPYPQSTDLVADYPALGQQLATDIENELVAGFKVVQIKFANKTSVFSTTSTSPVDVTGLSVSITPTSASNEILVLSYVTLGHYSSGTNQAAFCQLVRNTTAIFIGDAASNRTRASGATSVHASDWGHSYGAFAITLATIDAPATTSATTYKIQAWQTAGSGAFVGSSGLDSDFNYYARLPSSIIVAEVLT